MAPSLLTSHFKQKDATSYDRLDVPEPASKTFLSADIKKAKELDFNETNVDALFKKAIARPTHALESPQKC